MLYHHQSQSATEADKESVISFKGYSEVVFDQSLSDLLVALNEKSGDHISPQDLDQKCLYQIHPVDVDISVWSKVLYQQINRTAGPAVIYNAIGRCA